MISKVFLFGILGTFLNFAFFLGMFYLLNLYVFHWDVKWYEYLIFSVCLVTIDPTNNLEEITAKKFPNVYSILVGEKIVNNTISLIMIKVIYFTIEFER